MRHRRACLALCLFAAVPTARPLERESVEYVRTIPSVREFTKPTGFFAKLLNFIAGPPDDKPEIVGFLADKVHEVARIDASSIETTPRVGIHWRSEFIRGVGRRGADFLFILDINRIFVSDQQTSIGDGIRGGDRARPAHADQLEG